MDWNDINYQTEKTMDGSLTLRKCGGGESMHHSGGALSETLLIYGVPAQKVLESEVVHPKIMSLGLGLGYVELVCAALGLRLKKKIEIVTYESEDVLKHIFIHWLLGKTESRVSFQAQQDLNFVLQNIAEATQVPAIEIKAHLEQLYLEDRWAIRGPLSPLNIPTEKFNLHLYDAYSSKTCPDLWSDEFLNEFLKLSCADDCVFTTYACTGKLKRQLLAHGFEVIKRDGFKGKRNSTLGLRGIFLNHF